MTTLNEPLADARDMFAAHTMFRREFTLMPALVRSVPPGDRERAAFVADHITMVTGVLDHHHAGEDRYVWPPLLQRCPQACPSLVDVVAQQHQDIHHGLRQVDSAVTTWRDNAAEKPRNRLADVLDQLLPVMTEHLDLEEERVVPLIEQHVTQAEYARVAQGQAAGIPPDKLPLVLGMVMYETAPEIVDMIVAELPAEIRPIIRDLATGAYAAHALRLYGTVAPARGTL